MTAEEKKEAYRQRCREQERARRDALGLPQSPLAKPAKPRKRRKSDEERSTYSSDCRAGWHTDDLGESPDF